MKQRDQFQTLPLNQARYWVKASNLQLSFNIFGTIALNLTYNKNKLYKTLGY